MAIGLLGRIAAILAGGSGITAGEKIPPAAASARLLREAAIWDYLRPRRKNEARITGKKLRR
jgi:hypothetical protein